MLRLVGALLILATLAGGVLYFQSDVFRTKANQTVDEWTKWTPENITKDPKGYLNFALAELDRIKLQLDANKLELDTDLGLTEVNIKREQLNVKASGNALDGLKETYRVAKKTFPVSVNGKNLDEEAFQDKVVEVGRSLDMAQENVARLEQHTEHLTAAIKSTEKEMKNLVSKRIFVRQCLQNLKRDLTIGLSDELTSKAEEIAATAKALKPEGSKALQEAQNLIRTEKEKLQGQSARDYFAKMMESK